MNKILASLVVLSLLPTIVVADGTVSSSIKISGTGPGTVYYTQTITTSSGTFTQSLSNVGTIDFSSLTTASNSGMTISTSLTVNGIGSYSASKSPYVGHIPSNWNGVDSGFAQYKLP